MRKYSPLITHSFFFVFTFKYIGIEYTGKPQVFGGFEGKS